MNENVTVCITPKGEKPVLHFSQFDNERTFTVTVLADDGETAAVLTGLDIEFRLRKTDSHVVTIAPESVADNVITFKSTEQMCACCGQNIASVILMKDDMNIATLDILVEIQRDILSGGLTSESDIRNLTTQIEQIVPEVLADDYYTKTEVDELIDDIPTFDPTNYYDKTYINTMYWTAQQIDQLFYRKTYINDNYYTKDDVYTKSDVYNKSETDNLLSAKMDNIGYHGVVDDAAVISFTTDCNAPLDIIKGKITPVQSGTGTPSPDNVRPISGFSALNVTLADGDMQTVENKTVNFGQTVYGGVADVTNGKVNVTKIARVFDGSENFLTLASGRVFAYDFGVNVVWSFNNNNSLCSHFHEGYGAWDVLGVGEYLIAGGRYGGVNPDMTLAEYKTYLQAQYNNGTPVTLVATLSTPTEITTTPETVSSIAGDNNIFLDTGNLTEIAYFENAEDNLIKLIKACQI